MSLSNMSGFDLLCQQLRSRLSAADGLPLVDTSTSQAAVSVLLRQHLETAEILIIKRALSERDHWSGHLALPGGRWEAGDTNIRGTAARETFEEVGIDLSCGGEVLGSLDPVRPQSPFAPQITVTPFVSVTPPEYHIKTQNTEPKALVLSPEVQVAFWVPIPVLKKRGRSEVYRFIVNNDEREWLAYPSDHGPIWGLTERILTSFLELIE